MSNQAQTSGFLLRVALRFVVAAAVLPGAASGIGLLAPAETESPPRQAKTVEEAAIRMEAQQQRRHRHVNSLLVGGVDHQQRCRWTGRDSNPPPPGHRLPNHLIAPLLC